MFTQLLAKSSAKRAGEALYLAASRQARAEALYLEMGAPDSVEGRFELLTLHVILLIDRMKGASGAAAEVRQALFDAYVSNLDGALREMGVGDLAVGKRMRKLGEAFYGRAQAYEAAFQALPDRSVLEDTLARTALADAPEASPSALANYVLLCRHSLATGDLAAVTGGVPKWPSL